MIAEVDRCLEIGSSLFIIGVIFGCFGVSIYYWFRDSQRARKAKEKLKAKEGGGRNEDEDEDP